MRFFVALAGLVGASVTGEHFLDYADKLNEKIDGMSEIELERTKMVIDEAQKSWDDETYHAFEQLGAEAAALAADAPAFTAYETIPGQPHCDVGASNRMMMRATSARRSKRKPLFTFPLTEMLLNLLKKATGPIAAQAGPAMAMAGVAPPVAIGLASVIGAAVMHIVPPLIPPPVWNLMPFPCLPMLLGHNCFGAVLYPVTAADFIMAMTTDAQLDGYISGFPTTFAMKVGKTSDTAYKLCFGSYMSMHCSAIFPRCTMPQTRDEPIPAMGRVPPCLHTCILTLVACPGFWINDIIGACSMVSLPPLCTQALYWRLFDAPPQLRPFSENHPFPMACPPSSASMGLAGGAGAGGESADGEGSPILGSANTHEVPAPVL